MFDDTARIMTGQVRASMGERRGRLGGFLPIAVGHDDGGEITAVSHLIVRVSDWLWSRYPSQRLDFERDRILFALVGQKVYRWAARERRMGLSLRKGDIVCRREQVAVGREGGEVNEGIVGRCRVAARVGDDSRCREAEGSTDGWQR